MCHFQNLLEGVICLYEGNYVNHAYVYQRKKKKKFVNCAHNSSMSMSYP